MSPETITWIWLVGGIALMLAELIVPGAVVVFLGAAAVLVAGARWLGLIESLMSSFTAWFVLSLAMIIGLRSLVGRFSSAEKSVQPTEEDLDSFGKVVDVIVTIGPNDQTGRVRYLGTSWPARSLKGSLEPGSRARIVDRENLGFVVEPLVDAIPAQVDSSTPIKGGS
ncbi:MAG: NfeD family protein [Myxococcales bacterium]|jgi:membrane protein implicated in regulation of membrane protease activity